VKRFKESEVVKKAQVDNLIEQAFDKGIGFILSGDVGVGKTMALIYTHLCQISSFFKQFQNIVWLK